MKWTRRPKFSKPSRNPNSLPADTLLGAASANLRRPPDIETLVDRNRRKHFLHAMFGLVGAALATGIATSSARAENAYVPVGKFATGKGAGVTGLDNISGMPTVADITALRALSSTYGDAYLNDPRREGVFKWSSANNTTNCSNDPGQGIYVPPTGQTGSTGAWIRVLSVFKQVTPGMFGVAYTGIDTTAWNNLITSMNANLFDTVQLDAGVTTIDAALTAIVVDEWAIVGPMQGTFKINMVATAGTVGTVFTIGNGTTTCLRWRIAGVRFNFLNTATLNGSGNAIEIRNGADGIIERCSVDNANGAVTLGRTSGSTIATRTQILNCLFTAYTPAGGKLVDIQSQSGTKMVSTNFSGSGTAAAGFRGMYVHPGASDLADNMKVLNCEFNFGTPNPLYNIEYNGTNNSMATQQFTNCVFDQAVDGANFYVHIDGGAVAGAIVAIQCSNCTSNASTNANCILLDNTGGKYLSFSWTGGIINGGVTQATPKPYVQLTGGNLMNVLFSGTTFTSRSTSVAPQSCINVAGGSGGLSVVGCRVAESIATTTGTPFINPNYLVEFASTAANCTIDGNDCRKAQLGDIHNVAITGATDGSTRTYRSNNTARQALGGVVDTTDATVTTAAQVTLFDEGCHHIIGYIVGLQTGSPSTDRASYELRATVYRTGAGGATLVGTVTVVHSAESNAAWNATIDTNGNTVRIRVTGAAATNIRWATRLDILGVSNP